MGDDNAENKLAKPDDEVVEAKKNYKITKKFEKWVELYNDEKSETYGNATASAAKAYNVDLKNKYNTASAIGYQNSKKLQHVAKDYFQRKGFTLQRRMDILMKNALTSENPQWWDRAMKVTGDDIEKKVEEKKVQNTQINIFNTDKKTIEDWNNDFIDFMEGRK